MGMGEIMRALTAVALLIAQIALVSCVVEGIAEAEVTALDDAELGINKDVIAAVTKKIAPGKPVQAAASAPVLQKTAAAPKKKRSSKGAAAAKAVKAAAKVAKKAAKAAAKAAKKT